MPKTENSFLFSLDFSRKDREANRKKKKPRPKNVIMRACTHVSGGNYSQLDGSHVFFKKSLTMTRKFRKDDDDDEAHTALLPFCESCETIRLRMHVSLATGKEKLKSVLRSRIHSTFVKRPNALECVYTVYFYVSLRLRLTTGFILFF